MKKFLKKIIAFVVAFFVGLICLSFVAVMNNQSGLGAAPMMIGVGIGIVAGKATYTGILKLFGENARYKKGRAEDLVIYGVIILFLFVIIFAIMGSR